MRRASSLVSRLMTEINLVFYKVGFCSAPPQIKGLRGFAGWGIGEGHAWLYLVAANNIVKKGSRDATYK